MMIHQIARAIPVIRALLAPYFKPIGGVNSIEVCTPTTNAAPVSGVIRFSCFRSDRSFTASKLSAFTGGTAAGATPTLIKLGLYEFDGTNWNLIGSTVNDTSLFSATNTMYERSITPVQISSGKIYATAILIVSNASIPSIGAQSLVGSAYSSYAGVQGFRKVLLTSGGQTDLLSSYEDSALISNSALMFWGMVS